MEDHGAPQPNLTPEQHAKQANCFHDAILPAFDAKAARRMSRVEVAKAFPPFVGACPDCGASGTFYADGDHVAAGDWDIEP